MERTVAKAKKQRSKNKKWNSAIICSASIRATIIAATTTTTYYGKDNC